MTEKRVALITGSSRGIGRGIAEHLLGKVAVVIINGCDELRLQHVVKELSEHGTSTVIDAINFDVSDASEVKAAFEIIYKNYKRLDILVNNAGVMLESAAMTTSPEELQQTFSVNTFGSYYCSQYAARLMSRHKEGVIVNIGSVVAHSGGEGLSAYAASKAALEGLTKSLAKEWGALNIRVNIVAPGFIDTDLVKHYDMADRNNLCENIALARIGKVDDIASMVVFLTSDEAAYISGQVISVDGLMSL